jgi:hypothetical protein
MVKDERAGERIRTSTKTGTRRAEQKKTGINIYLIMPTPLIKIGRSYEAEK